MMRLLGAKLAFGLALLCTPAQAVQIEIAPLPEYRESRSSCWRKRLRGFRLFPNGFRGL